MAAVIVPKDNSAELNAVARKVAVAPQMLSRLCVSPILRERSARSKNWGSGLLHHRRGRCLVYDQDLSIPTALVMGAEGPGMRRLTTEACDFLVKLPMAGDVSSLNVCGDGICLFEAVRQRRSG